MFVSRARIPALDSLEGISSEPQSKEAPQEERALEKSGRTLCEKNVTASVVGLVSFSEELI